MARKQQQSKQKRDQPRIMSTAEIARRAIRRTGGQTPAMSAVPTALAEAIAAEAGHQVRVDALVLLAVERGMTWPAIAAALGVSRQGAQYRYRAALSRLAG